MGTTVVTLLVVEVRVMVGVKVLVTGTVTVVTAVAVVVFVIVEVGILRQAQALLTALVFRPWKHCGVDKAPSALMTSRIVSV